MRKKTGARFELLSRSSPPRQRNLTQIQRGFLSRVSTYENTPFALEIILAEAGELLWRSTGSSKRNERLPWSNTKDFDRREEHCQSSTCQPHTATRCCLLEDTLRKRSRQPSRRPILSEVHEEGAMDHIFYSNFCSVIVFFSWVSGHLYSCSNPVVNAWFLLMRPISGRKFPGFSSFRFRFQDWTYFRVHPHLCFSAFIRENECMVTMVGCCGWRISNQWQFKQPEYVKWLYSFVSH